MLKIIMNSTLINFLIAIKNAAALKRERVVFYYNKNFIVLAKILYKEGLIQDFWLEKKEVFRIVIILKYSEKSFFNSLKIISKPSKFCFFSYKDIVKLYEKHILYIFLTPFGFLSSVACKQKKIGGVLIFYV